MSEPSDRPDAWPGSYRAFETRPDHVSVPRGLEPLALIRFYFALPEPLAVPDGFSHRAMVSNSLVELHEDDTWADVVFHQIFSRHGRTIGSLDAVNQAIRRDASLDAEHRARSERRLSASGDSLDVDTHYTVVEAVTPRQSPDVIPERDVPAEFYPPRADPFARCLRLTTDIVRAVRHTTQVPYGLPTYPRIPLTVLFYRGAGFVNWRRENGSRIREILMTEPWSGASVMMLDHVNFPDPILDSEWNEDRGQEFITWMRELRRGNPLTLSRERLIEARRAREVVGDYGHAVTLANTSAETLLDVILALLMWEEKMPIRAAAAKFEEGKVLRRLARELAPRLGGDWATDRGPVGHWLTAAYRLRHRVVHGGYLPSAREAHDALGAVDGLQAFVMDRIAQRRNTYKRSALMVLAEPGLRSRNLWGGQIQRFAETTARAEPSWRDSFVTYHQRLVAAGAP